MKKLKKLIAPTTALLLIAYCTSFTALSQSNQDSTICFTTTQVKHFLRTAVELTNALETNELLVTQLGECQNREVELQLEIDKKQKKLKRTRWIAGGTGGLAVILGAIVIIK